MSFGVGVGDILAVGKLARGLYRDIYKVARHAPDEVQNVAKEVALLSQSIDLLIDEVKDPDSVIIRAGERRIKMTNDVVKATNLTLMDLEKSLAKYQNLASEPSSAGSSRDKVRRVVTHVKFAIASSSISTLRDNLQHHNSIINLVLTSAGNSSLERVERSNAKMERGIDEIRDLLSVLQLPQSSATTPLLSSLSDNSHFNESISATFLQNSEAVKPWAYTSTSFEEWIGAGKWWLMRAQDLLSLYDDSTIGRLPVQAYVDLLKSSWILIDILSRHPQLRFWSSTDRYKSVTSLTEVVKGELLLLSESNFVPPCLADIYAADMTIWLQSPLEESPTQSLTLTLSEGHNFWKLGTEYVVFSKFCYYSPADTLVRCECCVIILLNRSCDCVRIVVESQKYTEVDSFEVQPNTLKSRQIPWNRRSGIGPVDNCFRLMSYGSSPSSKEHSIQFNFGGILTFADFESQLLFECILECALFYSTSIPEDSRNLSSMLGVLLICIGEISSAGLLADQFAKRLLKQFDEIVSDWEKSTGGHPSAVWDIGPGMPERDLSGSRKEPHGLVLNARDVIIASEADSILTPSAAYLYELALILTEASAATNFDAVSALLGELQCTLHQLSIPYSDAPPLTTLLYAAIIHGHDKLCAAILHSQPELDTNVRCVIPRGGFSFEAIVDRGILAGPFERIGPVRDSWLPRGVEAVFTETPLEAAIFHGRDEVVSLLLHRPTSHIHRHNKSFPLHLSAYIGNVTAMAMLLHNLQSTVSFNQITKHGLYAFHYAAMSNDVRMMEMLVGSTLRPFIDASDSAGATVLHTATYYGHVETVKFLLDAPVHLRLNTPIPRPESYLQWYPPKHPLDLAESSGNEYLVCLLENAGAKPAERIEESQGSGKGIETKVQESLGVSDGELFPKLMLIRGPFVLPSWARG